MSRWEEKVSRGGFALNSEPFEKRLSIRSIAANASLQRRGDDELLIRAVDSLEVAGQVEHVPLRFAGIRLDWQ